MSGFANSVTGNNSVAVMGATVNGNDNIGMGYGAQSTASNTIAIGNGSSAGHDNAVAIGYSSETTEADTVSIGNSSYQRRLVNLAAGVNDTDAVNLGQLNAVGQQANDGTAIGDGASSNSSNGVAYGYNSSAKTNDTAIGYNARAEADGAVVVGANSATAAENSVAVGADSNVSAGATGGTAVGQNAQVQSGASNSVALGRNSVATEANTVSVGSAGSERRITNVADGINDTDAVNVRQLNAMETEVDGLRDDAFSGIAAAAALNQITMPSAPGKTAVSLGAANYKGHNAMGINITHALRSHASHNGLVSFGASKSSGNTLVRASVGFEF